MKLTEEEAKAIAGQLAQPAGEAGIEVANMMHETNATMTKRTFAALQPVAALNVLELGHGNANHLADFLAANKFHYTGLELSSTMHEIAKKTYQNERAINKVKFELYDGTNLPYADHSFQRIFTVNTL